MSTAESGAESAAPAAEATVAEEAAAEAANSAKGRKRLIRLLGGFIAVVVVVFGLRWLGASDVSTDDATVDGDVVALSVMVGGQVESVTVSDNARVKKGDVILQIDPVELNARLAAAEAELAAAVAQADAADAQEQVAEAAARGGLSTAKAQVSTTRASVGSAEAQVSVAASQLKRAQADARKAASELERGLSLVSANAITVERLDALRAASDAAIANEQGANASLAAANDALTVARSRVLEAGGALDANAPVDAKIASARAAAALAHARVQSASASADLAHLALTRATVIAPVDGTISRLNARVGAVLNPGQQVGFLVPDAVWFVANFKETQVGDMKPGQPVTVHVDSYPGHDFNGVVESLSAGTGSRFSLLAPDNASGNFVKVVQRIPVKIQRTGSDDGIVLRPGQSAVVTVHTGG